MQPLTVGTIPEMAGRPPLPGWLEPTLGLMFCVALGVLAIGWVWTNLLGPGELEEAYRVCLPDAKGIRRLSDEQIERILAAWRKAATTEAYRSGWRVLQGHTGGAGLEQPDHLAHLEALAEACGGTTALVAAIRSAYLATTYQYLFEDLAQFGALTAGWRAR